ncbi:MAG TPA: rRNA maturation RNase YbeY [Verrucomicrobiae bacterium]|nr:rRNA maturation RNase YbeY [Verrucomicrobiae bacterium]
MQLVIRNRQRSRTVNVPLLRQIIKALLTDDLKTPDADLGIFLVAAPEMTRVNETFLQHGGSTDVITFDYGEVGTGNRKTPTAIHGELFVCVDEAIIQARKFRTSWQSEVVRYVVHGVLHLVGHDDRKAAARRAMKVVENKTLAGLGAKFNFLRLDKGRKGPRLTA